MQYTLAELTKALDVEIQGDPQCVISGISPIQNATAGHITFLSNNLYRKYLETTKASAVVLNKGQASSCPVNAVISKNPYYTYAKIAEFFEVTPKADQGVHASAVIGEGSQIDPAASIAPQVVIGRNVQIAKNVQIGPGCVIMDNVVIGEGSQLQANVSIYHDVKIGKYARIAAGVVIGSDGFGFAPEAGQWHKVPQIGSVIIGDHVDIGANTAIDRGAVEDTVIGNGVKLDNQIQIGHNVQIGDHTVMAGCTAVAGSAIIGQHCMIGGASMILGHITIADRVMITGGTGVSKSITEPGVYSSGIVGVVTNEEFRKNNARFRRLESLNQRVKELEEKLKMTNERPE